MNVAMQSLGLVVFTLEWIALAAAGVRHSNFHKWVMISGAASATHIFLNLASLGSLETLILPPALIAVMVLSALQLLWTVWIALDGQAECKKPESQRSLNTIKVHYLVIASILLIATLLTVNAPYGALIDVLALFGTAAGAFALIGICFQLKDAWIRAFPLIAIKAGSLLVVALFGNADYLVVAITLACAGAVLPTAYQRMQEERQGITVRSAEATSGDGPYAIPPAPPVMGDANQH